MPMIQWIKPLSTAQIEVLRYAYEVGLFGERGKVQRNMHFRTEVILREGGFIEKGYDVKDELERLAVAELMDSEIGKAVECIGENWHAALEHLRLARTYESKLGHTAYWITEKGIAEVVKG